MTTGTVTSLPLDDISRLVAQMRSSEESQLTKLMDTQFGRVLDQVGHLDRTVQEGFRAFQKILDDHEARLRQQHDVDSKQAGEIGSLREDYAKLQGELKTMEARISGRIQNLENAVQGRASKDLDFWQRVGLEAIKMTFFGGAIGGVVVAALRLLGVM